MYQNQSLFFFFFNLSGHTLNLTYKSNETKTKLQRRDRRDNLVMNMENILLYPENCPFLFL